jgi:ribosome biogenesis GTPase
VAACPPGCTHLEPDCALDDWVRDQGGDPRLVARLDSLRRLLRSREGAEPA